MLHPNLDVVNVQDCVCAHPTENNPIGRRTFRHNFLRYMDGRIGVDSEKIGFSILVGPDSFARGRGLAYVGTAPGMTSSSLV